MPEFQFTSILETVDKEPEADVLIEDGSDLVHVMPPKGSKTFKGYAAFDFLPIYLVFDVYSPTSLKAETRSKRGERGRRKVTNKNTIASNWQNFMRHNDKNKELYHFLVAPNMVIVTKGHAVLSTRGTGLDGLDKCFTRKWTATYLTSQTCCRTW